jgi:DNA primase
LHDLTEDEIEFESPVFSKILARYVESLEAEKGLPEVNSLVREPDISEVLAGMITSPYELSENWEAKHKIYTDTEEKDLRRTVIDPLMRLKLSKIKKMLESVEESIKAAQTEEELHLHLQEKIRLDRMKIEVSNFFGSAII